MARQTLNKKYERFVSIPYHVISSAPFACLKAPETKLLLDVLLQYNGRNNGMLSACYALMEKRGWASTSLHRAFNNLQHAGFFVVTRQGWKQRGKPTLVAVTWKGIDEPRQGIDYDEGITPSNSPLSYWCKAKAGWKHKPKVKEIKKGPQKESQKNDLPIVPKKIKVAPLTGEVNASYSPSQVRQNLQIENYSPV